MQTLNRTTAPQFGQIEKIDLIEAVDKKLDNGIPVYIINSGIQELVKIEFLFFAGKWFESKPLIANATNSMLNEGTKNLSASDIADKIDYYGAFLQTESNADWASVNLFTLNKHLENTFPIIASGGVHTAEDAIEKIKAGASLVQIYTGLIYEGPGLVKKICKGLLNN